MRAQHLDEKARRVVTGNDSDGRSRVTLDEVVTTRVELPAFTLNDLWQVDAVPTQLEADDTLTDVVDVAPPPQGVVVRLVTFAADSEVDGEQYGSSIDTLHGEKYNAGNHEAVGMHFTPTVDIDTVIDGEIVCIMESGEEVLLQKGDTIINRGTKHAWSNRTCRPATVVATILPTNSTAPGPVAP